MNKRNLKHGLSRSPIYYCWQNLKRSHGGVCIRWHNFENFLKDMGSRPSSNHWLFRARAYQRSQPSNVSWSIYRRQFRDIWKYLTLKELRSCQRHIWTICYRGGYDFDAGMNELYLQDLSQAEDPLIRIHSWIKRFLPKILADLKKQRGEIRFNDEVKYGH